MMMEMMSDRLLRMMGGAFRPFYGNGRRICFCFFLFLIILFFISILHRFDGIVNVVWEQGQLFLAGTSELKEWAHCRGEHEGPVC